jgi:hypothetical protein
MERKLLGYDPAKRTAVEVRKSRRILRDPAKKPHIEVVARSNELGGYLYDFYLVTVKGERGIVHQGLYEDEARIEIHKYHVDKVELRMVR